jgi:hypothetical protein
VQGTPSFETHKQISLSYLDNKILFVTDIFKFIFAKLIILTQKRITWTFAKEEYSIGETEVK